MACCGTGLFKDQQVEQLQTDDVNEDGLQRPPATVPAVKTSASAMSPEAYKLRKKEYDRRYREKVWADPDKYQKFYEKRQKYYKGYYQRMKRDDPIRYEAYREKTRQNNKFYRENIQSQPEKRKKHNADMRRYRLKKKQAALLEKGIQSSTNSVSAQEAQPATDPPQKPAPRKKPVWPVCAIM